MSFTIVDAVRHVLPILAIRSLPFAAYVAVSRALSIRARLLITTAYVGGVFLASSEVTSIFFSALLGSSYYLVIASFVPQCALALRARVVTPGALFVAFVLAYLVLPSVLVPPAASKAFLIVGWDLVLSSYSYCVDVSSSPHRPQIRDCLFFLLVNPTLTYSNRGLRCGPPRLQWRALARVALGIATIFVGWAVFRPALAALLNSSVAARSFAHAAGAVALAAILRGAILYAAHSGLASVQIGFMSLIGNRVPERYNFPLLATSPLDFWRRWNTYVGGWLGKYVFIPLTRRFQRPFGARSKAIALVLTFVASGLLHDGYTYISKSNGATKHLQLFSISAFVILAWIGIERIGVKEGVSARAAYRTLVRQAPRFATLILLAFAAAHWG